MLSDLHSWGCWSLVIYELVLELPIKASSLLCSKNPNTRHQCCTDGPDPILRLGGLFYNHRYMTDNALCWWCYYSDLFQRPVRVESIPSYTQWQCHNQQHNLHVSFVLWGIICFSYSVHIRWKAKHYIRQRITQAPWPYLATQWFISQNYEHHSVNSQIEHRGLEDIEAARVTLTVLHHQSPANHKK